VITNNGRRNIAINRAVNDFLIKSIMAALLLYHTDCGTHDNLFLCSYMQFLNLYILLRLHTLQICFFSSTIAIRNRMI